MNLGIDENFIGLGWVSKLRDMTRVLITLKAHAYVKSNLVCH
jgi:hypothetical protein